MRRTMNRFVAAVLACLLASSAAAAPIISGTARAKDGDSLTVGEKEIRLFGIDAPELDQTCRRDGAAWPCGAQAANQLAALVRGKTVRCEEAGIDQYGRILARCRTGTTDVNQTMVALGFAVAYRRYASDYVTAEASARGNRLGIWAGQFELPSDYRHSEKASAGASRTSRAPAQQAPSTGWAARTKGSCNIKGNRNRKGQWIYHLPGMPHYDETRPEEIFCSEAEAQAAGYRRAIVR